jgi:hypothetical protein
MWFSTFVPLLVGVAGNIVIYSCVDVPFRPSLFFSYLAFSTERKKSPAGKEACLANKRVIHKPSL